MNPEFMQTLMKLHCKSRMIVFKCGADWRQYPILNLQFRLFLKLKRRSKSFEQSRSLGTDFFPLYREIESESAVKWQKETSSESRSQTSSPGGIDLQSFLRSSDGPAVVWNGWFFANVAPHTQSWVERRRLRMSFGLFNYSIKLIFLPFQTARRVIIETDIRRLQFYGQWIRHIQIFSFTEKVSGHIYSVIARYMFGKCLFPALKSLHIHSFPGIPLGNLEILPLLASSPLSTIEIKNVTYGYRVHLSSFLHEISRLHSAENHPVSTLYLGGDIETSVLPFFRGFAGISKLTLKHEVTRFYIENLRYLARHPLLSVLELDLSTDETQGIKPFPNSVVHTFQRIQTLALSGHAVHVLGILRYIHGECLFRVNLNIFGLGPEAPTDVLGACVERCTTMTPSLLDL